MSQDNELITRYCPSCGGAVLGRTDQFATRRQCPKCNQTVRYFDYPRDVPASEPKPKPRDAKIFFLFATIVGFAVFVSIACVSLVISGQGLTASFLAFFILLAGIILIAFALDRHHKLTIANHKLEYADEIKRNLLDAVQNWRGFKQNFDKLVEEQKSIIQQEKSITQQSMDQLKREINEREQFLDLRSKNLDAEMDRQRVRMSGQIEDRERSLERQILEIAEHRDAVQTVAEKYLKDLVAWTSKNITSNNFAASKEKLESAIHFCRRKGADVPAQTEKDVFADLREQFKDVVRKEAAREEQRKIKEQIREEEKVQAEIARELTRLQTERSAIEQAISRALARSNDEHSAEVQDLRRRLAEAEEKSKRAISLAQQTKSGYVYIISNIGSFGHDVFKIGMTRRLEPTDRIRELSGASVPFAFDVHMMISCENAPRLENILHKQLHANRINKVNYRKEYFRSTIDEIREIVKRNHGEVHYVATPEALDYHESCKLEGADLDFVEGVLVANEMDDDD